MTDKTIHHDDGQHDRSKSKGYNKPHSVTEELLNWGNKRSTEIAENNTAYNKGWKNAENKQGDK